MKIIVDGSTDIPYDTLMTFEKIKKVLAQFLGLFPSRLPTGMGAFEDWAASIISTYRMPTEDGDSIRYALATMIMHMGPTTAYKAKVYFALALNASAAKQVAGGVFQQIKQKQLEATKKPTVVSNGPGQQGA